MTPSVFDQQVIRLRYLKHLANGVRYYYYKTNQRFLIEKETERIEYLTNEISKLKQKQHENRTK